MNPSCDDDDDDELKSNCFCSRTGLSCADLCRRFLWANRSTKRCVRRIYSPSDKLVPKGAYNRCAIRAIIRYAWIKFTYTENLP